MDEALVGYFGYGSLVNRDTLRTNYVACLPARLKGWRRHWQSRGPDIAPANGEDIALLTVHGHAGTDILGMLVIDRAENIESVDRREARYDRVAIDRASLEVADRQAGLRPGDLPDELYVYVARPQAEPARKPRLLQSYLDAVMAGFHSEFGEEGVHHFLATTVGFERHVIQDRHSPIYPRAVSLHENLARRFDMLLEEAGVRFASGRHLG